VEAPGGPNVTAFRDQTNAGEFARHHGARFALGRIVEHGDRMTGKGLTEEALQNRGQHHRVVERDDDRIDPGAMTRIFAGGGAVQWIRGHSG
jgi:hypothetical protein